MKRIILPLPSIFYTNKKAPSLYSDQKKKVILENTKLLFDTYIGSFIPFDLINKNRLTTI
jgi:hypothetical protein